MVCEGGLIILVTASVSPLTSGVNDEWCLLMLTWLPIQVEDVTDDGKVVTKLLKKGKDYKRPNEGATVKVACTGRIGGPDGPIFEEHSKESSLSFVTDEGELHRPVRDSPKHKRSRLTQADVSANTPAQPHKLIQYAFTAPLSIEGRRAEG